MLNLSRLYRELLCAPYYRRRPLQAIRLLAAKWRLKQFRVDDPAVLLEILGIDSTKALQGLDAWRPDLEGAVARVHSVTGEHGGVSFEDGMLLYGLARAVQPESVIETGVAAGISTAFLGAAMVDNGHGTLYSIELPPTAVQDRLHADGGQFQWPANGVGWAIPERIVAQLGNRHELLLEDVRTALPRLLSRLSRIDLFFHDDLHTPDHMLWEYRLVWPFLRPGGLLASDDVNDGWLAFCREEHLNVTTLSNMQRFAAAVKPALT